MTRHVSKLWGLLVAMVMAFGAGCIVEPGEEIEGIDGDGKEDAINAANDPRRFAENMERNWETLREDRFAQGASEIIPWPDTYWPYSEDGYNHRWLGNDRLSPVELYDKAFNNWEPQGGWDAFMELRPFDRPREAYDPEYYERIGSAAQWAHSEGGLSRARALWNPDGTLSDAYSQCDSDGDNRFDSDAPDSCDLNGDDRTGSGDELGGIEGWWGHCHAWAPAAFMYAEPEHAVTVNGATFEVADIKALAEATMEGGRSLFLGGRCNGRDVERDEWGRPVEDECRDTNPGAFHIVLLNRMGEGRLSFVIDVTWDYQVWNQPMRDYRITRQEEVSLEQALQLLGRTDVTEYPYNPDAQRFVHVNLTIRYIVEGSASTTPYIPRIDSYTRTHNYDYLLELAEDGEIIGGEWLDNEPHPDFIWAPTGTNDVRSSWYGPVILRAADVQRLVDLATAEEGGGEGGEGGEEGGEETTFTSEPGLAIPDNDSNGVSDTIAVDQDLRIGALRVNVNITHTYRGDLRVELIHDGVTVTVFDRADGGADDLVDSFAVSDFNGQSAAGQWTLRVSDNAGIDTGTLNSWQLVVIAPAE